MYQPVTLALSSNFIISDNPLFSYTFVNFIYHILSILVSCTELIYRRKAVPDNTTSQLTNQINLYLGVIRPEIPKLTTTLYYYTCWVIAIEMLDFSFFSIQSLTSCNRFFLGGKYFIIAFRKHFLIEI